MEVLEAMSTTNACRYYEPDPVPRDLIVKVLEGARWAPTGSNSQPLAFIVVEDPAKRQALHDLYQPLWDVVTEKYRAGEITRGFTLKFLERIDDFARNLRSIPVLIAVCARTAELPLYESDRFPPVTPGASVYPAVQNLMLAARNEGLGTALTTLHCAVEQETKDILGVPDDMSLAAVIALGWPARPFPKTLRRRPLSELAFLDSYGTILPEAENSTSAA